MAGRRTAAKAAAAAPVEATAPVEAASEGPSAKRTAGKRSAAKSLAAAPAEANGVKPPAKRATAKQTAAKAVAESPFEAGPDEPAAEQAAQSEPDFPMGRLLQRRGSGYTAAKAAAAEAAVDGFDSGAGAPAESAAKGRGKGNGRQRPPAQAAAAAAMAQPAELSERGTGGTLEQPEPYLEPSNKAGEAPAAKRRKRARSQKAMLAESVEGDNSVTTAGEAWASTCKTRTCLLAHCCCCPCGAVRLTTRSCDCFLVH